MKRKRLRKILLVLLPFVIMQLPVSEADAATSASDFTMEGNELVKYSGKETRVSIPNTIEIIGESAFENNDTIELVVLPNSVENIKAYAFWDCDNLELIVLGKGITRIEDFAFTNCKGLKEITIPSTVTSIGAQAFADCVNLTDITIPPEVTEIDETAFDGCINLKIHYQSKSYAESYAQTFYEKQMKMPGYGETPVDNSNTTQENTEKEEQQEPNTETQPDISQNTSSSETTGKLLGSTMVVGNQAVVLINNKEPQVMQNASSNNSSESTDKNSAAQNGINETTEEPQNTQNQKISKFAVVDGKIVADQAYYCNKSLNSVTLPEGIEEIGQFSFARSSLSSIVIPEGVTDICYSAFYHCDNLTEVQLPETVETIEPKAFDYTAWVQNFKKNSQEDFLISGDVLVAYKGSDEKVEIPDTVRVIAAEVFKNHTEIEEVFFPNDLEIVGEGAFEGCTNLDYLRLGTNTTEIKDRAFAGCSLSKITIPDSVEQIGLKAFDDTVSLVYRGKRPIESHEVSAQRLSNEDYRNYLPETEEPGVTVIGTENVSASLEEAKRRYLLFIEQASDSDVEVMEQAYKRGIGNEMPQDMAIYNITLTDNSNISLTKLGKQALTVTIPLTEELQDKELMVFTLDRNGQLETLDFETIFVENIECIQFQTDYVSLYGICSKTDNDGDTVLYSFRVAEEDTDISSISAVIQQ